MALWSAAAVLRALVDTPAEKDCDPFAYDLLMQDLEPHQGLRRLFEPRTRLVAAAQRLAAAGYLVNETMLEEACNLLLGRPVQPSAGRAEVRAGPFHALAFT